MVSAFTILVVAIVAPGLLFAALGVKVVPRGYEYTVGRFGRHTSTTSCWQRKGW